MKIRLLILYALGLTSWGCITEIDLSSSGESELIILGIFSNSPGERTLRVSETNGLDTLSNAIPATAEIFENGKLYGSLTPLETGVLTLPQELTLLAGHTYEIEVSLPDGRRFRSLPQVVQPNTIQDSLTIEYRPRDERLEDGSLYFQWYAELYAHITTAPSAPKTYFRWQVDNSWSLRDWRDSLCYLEEGVDEFPAAILNPQPLTYGPQKIHLASRKLDFAFKENFYFNAYLHPIDSQAHSYYEKARTLSENEGTLFDELPAPLEGNIREMMGNEMKKAVLGYIEFSLADTARALVIGGGDIPISILERCHENACQSFPPAPPPPCPCPNCRLFFLEYYLTETSIRPDYWN